MIVVGSILVALALCLLSFVMGVRYCGTRMLPGILAKMTPLELGQLAHDAAQLRDRGEAAPDDTGE